MKTGSRGTVGRPRKSHKAVTAPKIARLRCRDPEMNRDESAWVVVDNA